MVSDHLAVRHLFCNPAALKSEKCSLKCHLLRDTSRKCRRSFTFSYQVPSLLDYLIIYFIKGSFTEYNMTMSPTG
ncbi:hypothetical protein L873DRAFT_880704 [Choiromyces venosus 120613-1]|uniref:Uncharacterized protein n=1 Tax=Choiromyces venosus 120613-1 TaxID=1336337 RepID=A0A3N4JND0_9PEZI|nr:hypothetical protein L873DRAFT_880704 [Choiromyces venosus 120613-1]